MISLKFLPFFLVSNLALGLIVHLSDLQVMSKRSDVIVHGYVGEQSVTNDDRGRIITLTQIEVIDGLKNAKTGEIITLYQVGGSKDGIFAPVIGGQKYEIGQHLILFGLTIGGNRYVSYGMGQGKFDIVGNKVIEDLGDVREISLHSDSRLGSIKAFPLTFDDLKMFKSEIKTILKNP